ncbi:MAG: MFS transporter [Bdellovibrionaceae bacterium]|nr:MFS transporter [Bdellovibrio sp.]
MNEMAKNKKPLIVIFITVFIYLLGFGIVIPIIPILGVSLGASPLETGLLLSIYSLMQFVFSPFWGRLSDRYGRRPILLTCLVGEVFAYLLFAQATNLEILFAARMLSGFFGASISTASAYISDITPPNERSKGMALIGAAFGLGFLFGPAIGGGLTVWAEHISKNPHFQTSFSSYWVSGLCAVTFVFAYFNLKETLKVNTEPQEKRNRFQQIIKYFKMPVVGPLIFVFFLSSLAMSTMEATFVLYMKDLFGWGIKEVSFGFAYIGVMIVITQGFLVRRLIPKYGEKQVLRFGLMLMCMGLTGMAIAQSLFVLAITQTLLALGIGFTNPSTLGSVSLLIDAKEQGAALGTTQGMASLGRIIGPLAGGALYGGLSIQSPFLLAGLMALIALFVVITIFKSIPNAGQKSASVGANNA